MDSPTPSRGANESKAAKLLGLSRGKLYTRMERFGLS